MAVFRGGRKNPNTIYLQTGPEPSDADIFWGITIEAAHRDATVALMNVAIRDTQSAAEIMAKMLRDFGMTTPAYPRANAAAVLQRWDPRQAVLKCSLLRQVPWPMASPGTQYRLRLANPSGVIDIDVSTVARLGDQGQLIIGTVAASGNAEPLSAGDSIRVHVWSDTFTAEIERLVPVHG